MVETAVRDAVASVGGELHGDVGAGGDARPAVGLDAASGASIRPPR